MGDNDPTGNEPAFPIRGGLHEHQFVGASLRASAWSDGLCVKR